MQGDLISIIMPVYNTARFLEACLSSILEQTVSNWELIAVDDSSTDTSRPILDSFQRKDSRVSVFPNSGRGIIDALNTGYAKSEGSYITRMDSDDLMPPDKLESFYNACIENPGAVITGKVSYFASGKPLNDGYLKYERWLNELVDTNRFWQEIYKECTIASPNWMIHRMDLDRIGGITNRVYPEDYDLVFRMYQAGLKVTGIDKTTHLWRDHDKRTSRNSELYKDNRFLDLKCTWFSQDVRITDTTIYLWGAGSKGKYIAQRFNALGLDFIWLTNNQKKTGHMISGRLLYDYKRVNYTKNGVVVVATTQDSGEIEIFCEDRSLIAIRFC